MERPADVEYLTRSMIDEIFNALGFTRDGWIRRIFGPIFRSPAHRFSQIAADFDRDVAQYGFYEAARRVLPRFIKAYQVQGSSQIPEAGPLIVASNHPGAYDSLVISASVPRRDLKVLASGIPFIRSLPCAANHLIYITSDPHERMGALRAAVRHLEVGGAILIFPTGTIDPDPANQLGAEQALEHWSPSLEVMLRKVPQAKALLTIVSGVIDAKWLRNPIVLLQREGAEQRRLAEFFQVMQQLVFGFKPPVYPHVTFAPPLTAGELGKNIGADNILDDLIMHAKDLLQAHIAWVLSGVGKSEEIV